MAISRSFTIKLFIGRWDKAEPRAHFPIKSSRTKKGNAAGKGFWIFFSNFRSDFLNNVGELEFGGELRIQMDNKTTGIGAQFLGSFYFPTILSIASHRV